MSNGSMLRLPFEMRTRSHPNSQAHDPPGGLPQKKRVVYRNILKFSTSSTNPYSALCTGQCGFGSRPYISLRNAGVVGLGLENRAAPSPPPPGVGPRLDFSWAGLGRNRTCNQQLLKSNGFKKTPKPHFWSLLKTFYQKFWALCAERF